LDFQKKFGFFGHQKIRKSQHEKNKNSNFLKLRDNLNLTILRRFKLFISEEVGKDLQIDLPSASPSVNRFALNKKIII